MYTQDQRDKIANTIIYLAQHIADLSKTKTLKLLYILDEISVKQSGLPFLNLQYRVWKFGPVAPDMYVELSSEPSLLKGKIKHIHTCGHDYIASDAVFCDDEFSENDMQLLQRVVSEFGSMNTKELIDYTHRPTSLWHTTAKRNGVLHDLEAETISVTDHVIDLSELIQYDTRKLALYRSYREMN
jgi:uncharacterized phage-associated protein